RAVDAGARDSVLIRLRGEGRGLGALARGRRDLDVDLRARLRAGGSDLDALLRIDEVRDLDGLRRGRQRRHIPGLVRRVVAGVITRIVAAVVRRLIRGLVAELERQRVRREGDGWGEDPHRLVRQVLDRVGDLVVVAVVRDTLGA